MRVRVPSLLLVPILFLALVSVTSVWGPAASAQQNKSAKAKAKKKLKKPDEKSKKGKKKKPVREADPDEDEEVADEQPVETTPSIPRERPERDLAIRKVVVTKVTVARNTAKYIPAEFDARFTEKLVQDLKTFSYLEPKAVGASPLPTASAGAIADIAAKESVDGALVLRIDLEEIEGQIFDRRGTPVKRIHLKYRVGELEDKNAVAMLSKRTVDDITQAFAYRGFVTQTDKKSAMVNLGSDHAVKPGMRMELFEFRGTTLVAPRRRLVRVKVEEVMGPSESRVVVDDTESKNAEIPLFAKASFENASDMSITALDESVVDGRWWVEIGGESTSIGADSAAPKYETRVFKVNSAPFGFIQGGNDTFTGRAAFGSARSTSETLTFFDVQGSYVMYQAGSLQNAYTLAAGGRLLMINVTPAPGARSALESTMVLTPFGEFRYQYVPKGRVRLIGIAEVFWPVYSTGADVGSLLFAFGAGAGGAIQIAISPRMGLEVSGRVRYLRRLVEGQSGIQERQSTLGAGLIFNF